MRLLERTNLDVIYEAELLYLRAFHPKVAPPPLEAFRARYEDAPGVSFMDGERCVGGIVVKDRLAHIGVLPEFQGGWARLWPAAYDWMFGVSDPVYALMQPANRKVVALVRRTGGKFVKNVKVPQMGSMMLYELRPNGEYTTLTGAGEVADQGTWTVDGSGDTLSMVRVGGRGGSAGDSKMRRTSGAAAEPPKPDSSSTAAATKRGASAGAMPTKIDV